MLLGIYLNDHLAGATAGRDLARRTAASNLGSSFGPFLAGLASEIDEDRDSLLKVMAALGIRPDPVKVSLGWLVEKSARLKPNGRLRGYSPLSRVVELEGHTLGVNGKLAGWRTLDRLQSDLPALRQCGLDALRQRAETQLVELEAHRLEAVVAAFPDG